MHGLKFTAIAAFAASVSSVMATPPACLLACVGEVEKQSKCDSLADLECICTSIGEEVEQCLEERCPNGDADTAKDAFEASCKAQGHDVSGKDSSSSSVFESSSSASSSAASSSAAASSSSAASSSVAAPSFVSSEEPTSAEEPTTAETTSAAPSTLATSSTEAEEATSSAPAAVSSFEAGAKMNAASFGVAIAGVVGALL
ncbi:hypothetical protein CXQ85_000629 [Candidozyma haemuli]|uniref:CFEM domain-containing protein n=1 Tax=Candidozyma haemuli TaxID=45357 RepID=A0A2V1AVV4_9ASCO|nr:hypothetical protein CXQ85_000629 [[Candida] haemuloni]PVH21646.1 hypothetical protein CXQ85_000629 [[Candida] haemuloni]